MNKKNNSIIKYLKNSLIASCQPIPKGPLDSSSFILASAKASIIGGAKALRIEGFKNLKVIKKNINLPVIGIKKRITKRYPVIITPLLGDVEKKNKSSKEETGEAVPDISDEASKSYNHQLMMTELRMH